MLAPPNSTTGAIDVAINPENPQIVYGVLWDYKRTNGTRTYGGVGSGLLRSDDGGTTWKRLDQMGAGQAMPSYDQTGTGLKRNASLGRIGVAVAPSNPNRVYVVFGSPYGPDKGFNYSNDGGNTWCTTGGTTACPFPRRLGIRGQRLPVVVRPRLGRRLPRLGGAEAARSRDGRPVR